MATKYLGSTSGLTILSSAGQTRISSGFNSCVMPDGIKGAWLSSVDAANLTNGGTDPDRSGNGNDLDVTGTITKTAVSTGAELMGYSGFSSNNYLEQPNNTDLDFGTGDFSMTGWIKTSTTADITIVNRCLTGSGGGIAIRVLSTGRVGVYFSNTTSFVFVSQSTGTVNSDTWTRLSVKRRSGVLYWNINGVLDNSFSNSTDLTYASAILRVGNAPINGGTAFTGSISQLHFSNTAPTDAQDLAAYNLEKPLFYPNALAVLSADSVTALSHDPVTDLLYVGGASGMATVSGITPITRDATAVTTFISVVDEMEIKQ